MKSMLLESAAILIILQLFCTPLLPFANGASAVTSMDNGGVAASSVSESKGSAVERTRPTVANKPLPPQMADSIRSVSLPEEKRFIALTFDLCEVEHKVSGYDSEVVDFLRAKGVRATFFACGKWMRSHPEKTIQLMSDPLFEIGSHGWNHRNLHLLDKGEIMDQILRTQAEYETLWEEMMRDPSFKRDTGREIPRVPQAFRFPFGRCDSELLGTLRDLGLPAIQWDIVSGDAARGQTAKAIIETVMRKAHPGSIVVFHANGRGHGTAQSLTVLVPKLREKGFQFVTISELLAAGTPVTSPDCYETRPGDSARYDKFGLKAGGGKKTGH